MDGWLIYWLISTCGCDRIWYLCHKLLTVDVLPLGPGWVVEALLWFVVVWAELVWKQKRWRWRCWRGRRHGNVVLMQSLERTQVPTEVLYIFICIWRSCVWFVVVTDEMRKMLVMVSVSDLLFPAHSDGCGAEAAEGCVQAHQRSVLLHDPAVLLQGGAGWWSSPQGGRGKTLPYYYCML